jgi:hypothetical protein
MHARSFQMISLAGIAIPVYGIPPPTRTRYCPDDSKMTLGNREYRKAGCIPDAFCGEEDPSAPNL